jgi:hypothetical protein
MAKKMCKDDSGDRKMKKDEARFECKSCKAVSDKEKKLCKPKKI